MSPRYGRMAAIFASIGLLVLLVALCTYAPGAGDVIQGISTNR